MSFSTNTAKIAAHESWARTADRSARTRMARNAMEEKFLRIVDPEQTLPEAVRRKMAESAKRAHFRRMALASANARRVRNNEKAGEVPDAG